MALTGANRHGMTPLGGEVPRGGVFFLLLTLWYKKLFVHLQYDYALGYVHSKAARKSRLFLIMGVPNPELFL